MTNRAHRRLSPRFLGLGAVLALLTAGIGRADQILQTNNDSLIDYKYLGTSRVQGVRPRAEQRGVNLDGTLRLPGALPWAIAGNPFESPMVGETLGDVRLMTGTYSPTEVDLTRTAQVPWVIGRSFNVRQTVGGNRVDSDGYQGKNWFQSSQPEIRLYDADGNTGTKEAEDLIYLIYGADRYVEYKRTDDDEDTFRAVNGAAGVFKYVSGSPDTYVLTDQHANRTYFFGSNAQVTVGLDTFDASWQVWKFVDPAGNVAYVGDSTTASTAISTGYNTDGRIKRAFDSGGTRYCYEYGLRNGTIRLLSVLAEIDGGGGWGNCGEEVMVGKVEYEYYQTGDNTWGQNGNLKLVTITTPLSDGLETIKRRKYYRYYMPNPNPESEQEEYTNALMLVLGYEGTRRNDWQGDGAFDESYNGSGVTTASLFPYAEAYFEYNLSYQVTSVFMDGQCGCSGSINGTHALDYQGNPNFSNTSGYDTAWHSRVVIDPPSGVAWTTQYLDEVGQPLSRVLTDISPASSSPVPKKWVTQVVRNSDGQVTQVHTPANVTAYTHNDGSGDPDGSITTSGSVGLVHYYERVGSGAAKGFLQGLRQKEGTTSLTTASTYTSWTQYTSRDLQIASGVNVTRPLVEKRRAFHTATNDYTASADYDETLESYTWWDTVTNTNVLYMTLKDHTTAAPAVSTSKNGSGSSTTTKQYFRKDGTVAFSESARGIVTYTRYNNGKVCEVIEDAKTNTGTAYPTGEHPISDFAFGIDPSADGFHRSTIYTFDYQRRLDETTLPTGRITKLWYSRLGDDRMVTFSIPNLPTSLVTNYAGPAGYTVSNHTGSTEDCLVIAVTGGQTATAPSGWLLTVADIRADDPVEAFNTDVGVIAQATASIYNDTGRRLLERRVYFRVPSALPGSNVTDYDAWKLGYDDAGRQDRMLDPTGTIQSTTHDVLGRVTSRLIGTNDAEVTGPDDMVTTEDMVYDAGNDGGNSLLTKHTRYVEDGATNKRETTFLYDHRGRRIVTVGPQAPYPVAKFDNLDRPIAVAEYINNSSLTAATDPTGTTGYRCAMNKSFYDERGQVWKQQWHKIDQSSGADLDNLETLSWYDPDGALIKQDGEELRKIRCDRLGREIQSFVLATDNDAAATYSDVYDSTSKYASLAGDKVLVERQTGYDGSTDLVLIRATIERNHGDTSTTGPLDTTNDGGDGDRLAFTAGDCVGRIQIDATWYDGLDRPITQAFYGTNSASDNIATFDRDGLSEPSASANDKIVTKTVYNDDGSVKESVDASGRSTRFEYDAAGRVTASVANFTGASLPITTELRDHDIYTRYRYEDGLQKYLWVDQRGDDTNSDPPIDPGSTQSPADDNDQVTQYVYGTEKGTVGSGSPWPSVIGSGHLLHQVIYPAQSGGQMPADRTVTYAYNAQGEQVWMMDQVGNIIQTDYDTAGRETHRRITTLDGSFDGAVRRISTTYLSRGLVNKVTQYSSATVGSGTLLDDVKYTYDEWGNLSAFIQDVDSDIDGSASGRASFQVGYTYSKATTGRNTLRRSGGSLPGSTSLLFQYLSSGGQLDNAASRVTRVNVQRPADGAPIAVAKYDYLGADHLVGTDLLEASARWNQFEGAVSGTPYPGLDPFNRAKSCIWTGYKNSGTRDFYDIDITYDYNSNITSVTDHVHKNAGGNRSFDVLYSMDDLDRLTRAEEGTLSGGAISSPPSRDEQWLSSGGGPGLSQTGNQIHRRLDLNGNGAFNDTGDLDETNTFNVVNELRVRDPDSNAGTTNYTLAYDKNGNQIDDGKDYLYVYDGFGRLRQVKARPGGDVVSEYRYNGLGFRIGWRSDTDFDGDVDGSDTWTYLCHDESWRIVASFIGAAADPKEVFVHHNAGAGGYGGSSYIDHLILRDRDTGGSSDREERLYYWHNWRGDVSGILTDTGKMVEWVKYSAYGVADAVPCGDTDADRDWDATDSGNITGTYGIPKDTELDGDVDAADITHANSITGGYQTLGRGVLSSGGVANHAGYAGYQLDATVAGSSKCLFHVRYRVFDADQGLWKRRDPLGNIDSASLYSYGSDNPATTIDPLGLMAMAAVPCDSIAGPEEEASLEGGLQSEGTIDMDDVEMLEGALVGGPLRVPGLRPRGPVGVPRGPYRARPSRATPGPLWEPEPKSVPKTQPAPQVPPPCPKSAPSCKPIGPRLISCCKFLKGVGLCTVHEVDLKEETVKKELRRQFEKAKREIHCRCKYRNAPTTPERAGCPGIVQGVGDSMAECQRNAKMNAPAHCRRYYGHCQQAPNLFKLCGSGLDKALQ